MSLLMDALRKAERLKQQGKAREDPPSAAKSARELTLDPLPDSPRTPNGAGAGRTEGLPELPKRLEELDEQFLSIPPAAGKTSPGAHSAVPTQKPSVSKPGMDAARANAQNLFASKQPDPPVRRNFAIGIGIATLLASLAIGAYFYWQLQPKGGLALSPATATNPSTPPTARPPENTAGAASVSSSSALATASSPTPSSEAATKPQQPAATIPAPKTQASVFAGTAGASPTLSRSRATRADQPPATEENAIRLAKQPPLKIDETQEAAHAAYTRGEFELARTLWLKALRTDARNLNALLGLAAVAQQEGRLDLAERFFKQALDVDPKDPVANAGLLALAPPSDPRVAESRLKGLLADQPDSAHLHFALGNLYLGEARWAEAQQAFFKAHVADPGNADYLYNLAVSLDHLHQERLAAEYYVRALAAATARPAAFDRAQAEARLQALQAVVHR